MSRDFDIGSIDLAGSSDIDGFLTSESNEVQASYTQNAILARLDVHADPTFDVGQMQVTGSPGLDVLFKDQPQLVTASSKRRKVASVGDLSNFLRLSAETLVHKSERELWALKKGDNGSYFIERLFDDNGEPLKG
jgi:hypothetical protein